MAHSRVSNFTKCCPLGAETIHEERQVDRHNEVNCSFLHVWGLTPKKNTRVLNMYVCPSVASYLRLDLFWDFHEIPHKSTSL